MNPEIYMYITFFIFGICIGSFLNVCIFRIPKGESIVIGSSHCSNCNNHLKWYDMFPIFSWIILGGKCRYCGEKIAPQYPIIETLTGFIWIIVFYKFGFCLETLLSGILVSILLVISVIDERTLEIPLGLNIAILVLGIFATLLDLSWTNHIIGLFAISIPLLLIQLATKGQGIGGGDIKLMAVCGLFLGWELIILAFFVGCILGTIIHFSRMKITKKDHVLAFGPYLSLGVFIALIWGNNLIDIYLGMFI